MLVADAAAPRANLRPPALHVAQAPPARAMQPQALPQATRRAALAAFTLTPAAARAAQLTDQNPPVTRPEAGRAFGEAILPPVPFGRATYRYDLGRGAYAFEQLLRFQNVSATVRMNVQRLRNGKLWVVAPVAPTGECLSLLKDIGEVEHLVLPVTALEHKAFFGPFQRQFPAASVWAAPGQYGPFGTLGFEPASSTLPFRVDGVLPRTKKDKQPPWASEIDTKTFYVDLPGNAGPVAEAAFFHKDTKTLFVTDAVSWIPRLSRAPEIFRTSFDDKTYDNDDFWPKSVSVWKSKFYGAFVPNRRVDLHAIDATPARWLGDADSSPLDETSAATPSPRHDLVKFCRVHPTHWLISTQVRVTSCLPDVAQRWPEVARV